MAQNEKSKNSSSKQSKSTEAKGLSLTRLTKQLPTKCRYKGYDVRLLSAMGGWISLAKKDNLIVAGVEPNGNLIASPNEKAALTHICSLIDLSESSSNSGLNQATVESLFNDR